MMGKRPYGCKDSENPQLVAKKARSTIANAGHGVNERHEETPPPMALISVEAVVEKGDDSVGLLLLWSDSITVSLQSYSKSHIDVEIQDPQYHFRFTGMYGNSDHSHKAEDWNLLDNLRHRSQLPWLLGGDLNAILCRDEKEGGRRNPRSEMGAFRDALECNGLWDIKPNKGWFTWNNG
ncbi:hypothetical protein V6N13_071744 [Hibiscus sabdariffa]